MISSRFLTDLHPHLAELCNRHIEACAVLGIHLLVYCTYRDREAQAVLYAQGREGNPGKIVTFAKPGQSAHNYRLAYDAVPVVNGKAAWDDVDLLTKVGELGESVGLEWAGRWVGPLRERVHFQWTNGLNLAELQRGVMPS